jgi:peptidyl-Lys metalloendopeptidase
MEQPPSVSAAYDFTRSGAGMYSIEPSSLFTYVDGNGITRDFNATVEDVAEVELFGNLAVSRAHDKRIFLNCDQFQAYSIRKAIEHARGLVVKAHNYLRGINANTLDTRRYNTWFGKYTLYRATAVQTTFQQMLEMFDRLTYECGCCDETSVSACTPQS